MSLSTRLPIETIELIDAAVERGEGGGTIYGVIQEAVEKTFGQGR